MKLIIEHTVEIKASRATVWSLLEDINNWATWDEDVQWAKLDGELRVGQQGKLKPRGGPVSKFEVTQLVQGKRLVDKSNVAWMKLVFDHIMEEKAGKIILTHKVGTEGIGSGVLHKLMGKQIREGLPTAMNNLKKLAESKSV